MKDFDICWSLSVRVEFVENGISLCRRQFIEELVQTFSFHKENKVYIPMEPYSTPRKFLNSEDEKLDPDLNRDLIGSWCNTLPERDQISSKEENFDPHSEIRPLFEKFKKDLDLYHQKKFDL